MQTDHGNSRANRRGLDNAQTAAAGFRPLALPAVVAAIEAMARRAELRGAGGGEGRALDLPGPGQGRSSGRNS